MLSKLLVVSSVDIVCTRTAAPVPSAVFPMVLWVHGGSTALTGFTQLIRVLGFLLAEIGAVMLCILHLGHSGLDEFAAAIAVVIFDCRVVPVAVGTAAHLGWICCGETPRRTPVPGVVLFFFVAVVEEDNAVAGDEILGWHRASRMRDVDAVIEPGF